jgi:hypothetical protein
MMIGLNLKMAALLATFALTACGGGDDSGAGMAVPSLASADALASVPGSTQTGSDGLVTYQQVLVANIGEDGEALNVDALVLTRSENSEPLELQ